MGAYCRQKSQEMFKSYHAMQGHVSQSLSRGWSESACERRFSRADLWHRTHCPSLILIHRQVNAQSPQWWIQREEAPSLTLAILQSEVGPLGTGSVMKRLPSNHRDLRADLQNPSEKPGTAVQASNPCLRDKRIPGLCWPSNLAQSVRFRYSGRPVSNNKMESN